MLSQTFDCRRCSDLRKKLQGCPDIKNSKPQYRDGVINVGSCGTRERNWLFDKCPGFYLRKPCHGYKPEECATIDGHNTAFDKAWKGHFAFKSGHSIGEQAPPKMQQAIELFEVQMRTKDALSVQKQRETAEEQRLKSKHPNAKIIARG